MVSYDAANKIRIIKEFRQMMGLGLKEAKDKVDKVPFEVKTGLSKEEAEELCKKLESFGAKMKMS
jgi:large subunit ribosomal protein L7/L12